MRSRMHATKDDARHLITRIAVALVFITFGIWEITDPKYWAAFMPAFVAGILSPSTAVLIHGILLLAIGAALLTGFYLRIASALAVIMLLLIVLSLMYLTGYIQIVIRDTAIMLLALSIFFDDTRYLCIKE